MVDERGNATVGVELGELGGLVLALVELQVDRLVGQAKLLKNEGDLPTSEEVPSTLCSSSDMWRKHKPSVRTTLVGVKSELLAVRHGR